MFPASEVLFFKDPGDMPENTGRFGILYLLRRDIRSVFSRGEHQSIWLGAMGILAGVDLLAKFYAGNDVIGQVGPRFLDYVSQYFHLNPHEGEVVYQLRNSLLHSFGLYSSGRDGAIYRFTLVCNTTSPLIIQPNAESYIINIHNLHQVFERSIGEYRTALLADTDLQTRFLHIFPNYGAINIG